MDERPSKHEVEREYELAALESGRIKPLLIATVASMFTWLILILIVRAMLGVMLQ